MKLAEEIEKSGRTGAQDILVDSTMLMGFLLRFLPRMIVGGAVGTLLGGVVFFGVPRSFEAISYLEVSSIPLQDIIEMKDAREQIGSLVKTVEVECKSPIIINSVVNRTGKEHLNFHAKNIVGTRRILLRVRAASQEDAVAGVNLWAKAVVDSFNSQLLDWVQSSKGPLKDYYSKSSQSIDTLELKIRELSSELEMQQTELAAIKKQNVNSVEEITNIGPQIEILTSKLPILKKGIAKIPEVLPQKQTAKSEKILLLPSGDDKGKVMGFMSYGSNPLFIELSNKISDTEINLALSKRREEQLKTLLKAGVKKQEVLSRQVNKSLLEISQMERELGVLKSGFDLYYGRLGQFELSKALATSNVRIVHLAEEATHVSYLLHCLVIGFTLGLFIISLFPVNLLSSVLPTSWNLWKQ